MSINPVSDSSVWMRHQADFYQQTSQIGDGVQGHRGDEDRGRRLHRHQGGGMGRAFMQTLKQLLQSLPSDAGAQSATETGTDGDQSGEEAQARVVRTDLHNFMHAFFQAIGSHGQALASNTGPYPSGFDGSKFESGLSALISQLTGDSSSGAGQLTDLQTTFSTLVQDLQNSSTGGPSGQASQGLTLQGFLTTLQQNLENSLQPISTRGNMVNIHG